MDLLKMRYLIYLLIIVIVAGTVYSQSNNLNLNVIRTLKKKFRCEVGYSGHETSTSPSLIT